MNRLKVINVWDEGLEFENGVKLKSAHDEECCEYHWLDFSVLSLVDFSGMVFDLTNDGFFERVADYGIRLIPVIGHPVSVAGYGTNNGYYSDELTLEVITKDGVTRHDIRDCQVISG